ncbi:hypothetical protein ACFL5Z_03645, partial [Planctomycetota bacterium]
GMRVVRRSYDHRIDIFLRIEHPAKVEMFPCFGVLFVCLRGVCLFSFSIKGGSFKMPFLFRT